MSAETREQLIDAARRQFAGRGFYGASIASIADELGLLLDYDVPCHGVYPFLSGDTAEARQRWLDTMGRRPACCRGLDVPAPVSPERLPPGEEFAKYRRYLEIVAAMKKC